MRLLGFILVSLVALPAAALDLTAPFGNIDGGEIRLSDWSGQPVLVVNTASRCGFTPQYDGLQTLYDRYRDRGLVVLAVPSDDFRQELSSEAEVKEFCEVNFGLDLPMTTITSVSGNAAHPFYASLRTETGFAPSWNFNKVLIAPDGRVIGTWGSTTRPTSGQITQKIEALID
ncbi:glutathione peroxidase [Roseovarius sp. 217]|uniref:glutathione peroxidase n=1 Tax=Roseovarius sp. (strain 217) TaxID=314264 RepID=UPI0000685653|nr:glutathione peroxidase [Roseovarius sp. 217]EAQ24456.1 glutathione peroxidase famly protein [Roseovarius sp. 217]